MRATFRAFAVLVLLGSQAVPAVAQELSPETLQAINTASRARVRLGTEGWHRLAGTGSGMSADGGRVYVREGSGGSSLTEVALGDVGTAAFAIVMYLLFLPLSFLIPSSSGLATVAMPIMAPLAGFVDLPAQVVVTAYQSANGLMNLFIPTSAVVMGGLAIARVPYGKYLKWVWPLLALLAVLTVIVLAVAATAA